jgi:MoaA/NifB/PqqE/SkfB family radical SAM enzyme
MDGKGDMSLEEIEGIFRQLPQMDSVRLSGGEPFVRKDVGEIAESAQERLNPWFLHITTNGFLTDRIVNFLERRPKKLPLYLLVSIDGLAEKHNRIRGVKKAWEWVNNTLAAVAPRQKELNLWLGVNQTVVDDEGLDEYFRLKDYLKRYGTQNNLVFAYDVSATYNLEDAINVAPQHQGEYSSFGHFSQAKLQEFFPQVGEQLKEYPWKDRMAKRYYFRGMENRLLRQKGEPNPPCVALSSHMRLLPDGKIPVCQFNNNIVGDLRESSFEEIWYGSKINKSRRWVRNCPGCWAECEALPNGLYTGDVLRALFLG